MIGQIEVKSDCNTSVLVRKYPRSVLLPPAIVIASKKWNPTAIYHVTHWSETVPYAV